MQVKKITDVLENINLVFFSRIQDESFLKMFKDTNNYIAYYLKKEMPIPDSPILESSIKTLEMLCEHIKTNNSLDNLHEVLLVDSIKNLNEYLRILSVRKNISDLENTSNKLESDINKYENRLKYFKEELDITIPSIKSEKMTKVFSKQAHKYKNQSTILFIVTVLGCLLLGYVSFKLLGQLFTIKKITSQLIIESVLRLTVIPFGVYIIVLFSNKYKRAQNLYENYQHKESISDYYLAIGNNIREYHHGTQDSYNDYIKSLLVKITDEVVVAPRDIHKEYRSPKWSLSLNLKNALKQLKVGFEKDKS